MQSGADALTPDLLLAHERFVRRVANDLLRDEHAVHDVVQDTWLRALLAGPRALAALPRWLARTAANRAVDVRRAAARRQRHEGQAAIPGHVEPVAVTVERLSVQREVVAAILALHEPYRTVVLMRYYHDLEPTEIAAQLGGKPATVRTQLVRAHELLRERLDRTHGSRDAWAPVLIPAFAARAGVSVIAVVASFTAAAGVVVLGAQLWRGPNAKTAAVAGAAAGGGASDVVPHVDREPATADATTRIAAVDPRAVRVVTAAGEPAAGVPVWFWANSERPLWTLPARPRPSQPDYDTRLRSAAGELRPADAGPAATNTDAAGVVVLPEPTPAAMTLQPAESVWFTAELPAELPVAAPLVLPELATFCARIAGLPSGATWDFELGSVPGKNELGDFRANVATPGGTGVVFAGVVQRRALRDAEFTTRVLARYPVVASATGHGVRIESDSDLTPVPATVVWPVVATLPTITVRVHERNGARTTRRGGVWIYGDSNSAEGWLADGTAVFDTVDVGPRPRISVRMADGESIFRHEADFSSAGMQRVADVVLDGALPPLRVHLPDLATQRLADVIVQYGGNNFRNHGYYDPPRFTRNMVGLHEGAVWLAEYGTPWEAAITPIVWERLAVATEAGGVALVSRPPAGDGELWGAWEPVAPPRDVDLAEYITRLNGVLPKSAFLQFELKAIPSPRRTWGKGTESRWHVVRSHSWDDESQPAPVWRGLRLATTVPWRLHLKGRDHEDLAVFELAR